MIFTRSTTLVKNYKRLKCEQILRGISWLIHIWHWNAGCRIKPGIWCSKSGAEHYWELKEFIEEGVSLS